MEERAHIQDRVGGRIDGIHVCMKEWRVNIKDLQLVAWEARYLGKLLIWE